jgi:hypothetical protein
MSLSSCRQPSSDALETHRPTALEVSLNRYKVNLLEDRSGMEGAPVVFEPNPTYQNVFGRIEKKAFMGTLVTDFTMVQSGSLLKANGGFLIHGGGIGNGSSPGLGIPQARPAEQDALYRGHGSRHGTEDRLPSAGTDITGRKR